jgi:hypothetical protein
VSGGIFDTIFETTLENLASALRNQLIIELLFAIAITFLRLGIGLQLWALVKLNDLSSQRKLYSDIQRGVIIFVVGILVLYDIPWLFTLLFTCSPVDFFWNRVLGASNGTCLSNSVQAGISYTQAILSFLSDFALALLPIWILWGVNMPFRLKATVTGLLAAGIAWVIIYIYYVCLRLQN